MVAIVNETYCIIERDDVFCFRHLYYQQLKSHVLQGRLSCIEEAAIVLASYIAQGQLMIW